MIARMAWRNLRRRPVQSMLAGGAVAVGLAVCVFLVNFQFGAWALMQQDTVRSVSGHVVVQPIGYQDSKDSKLVLEGSAAIAERMAAADPTGTVLRRSFLQGLVASPNNTVAVALNAVEPSKEAAESPMVDKIVQGSWFEAEDASRILIGVELARRLQVEVGDKVVVTTSSKGEMQARPLRVQGVFETNNVRTDSFFAIVPLAIAQALQPAYDDPATQVALLRDDLEVPPSITQAVREAVGAGFEVLPWREAMPEANKSEELDKAMALYILTFLAAIATVGILNVLLMSLFQRTRELGVMLAVGMKPADVARLLLMEGLLLGILGAAVGLGVGLLATWPAHVYGFNVAELQNQAPVANVAIDSTIRSQFMLGRDLAWTGFFVLLSAVSCLWPALRAARLEPVESLRSV